MQEFFLNKVAGLRFLRVIGKISPPGKAYNSISFVISNFIFGKYFSIGKSCSRNIQQLYRRTPMHKCAISKVIEITLPHGCSPVNLLHICRTAFREEHLPQTASDFCNLKLIFFTQVSEANSQVWDNFW